MTEQFDAHPAPTRRRGVGVAVVIGAVLLLVAGYVGVAAWSGGRVPADTTVGGVKVGGLEPAEARRALESGVRDRAATPVTLTAGSKKATISPAEAGLGLDLDASLEGLTGFSLNPVDVWGHLTGGVERGLESSVDEAKLTAAVEKAAATLAVKPREGSISVEGGKVALTEPVKGQTVEVERTRDLIASAWPRSAPIVAPVTEAAPKVSAQELRRVKTEFADKAMSGPVAVKAGDKVFDVSAAALAPAISFPVSADGKVTPRVDDKILLKAVTAAAEKAGAVTEAKDAKVVYASGQPSVEPSKPGVAIDPASVVGPVTEALTSPDRAAAVAVKVTQPSFTTDKAKATLPKGQISTFTTYFDPNGGGRVTNIRLAARTLNGTYVPPGGTLSLNGVLGQRTPAKGYQKGGVISNGRLSENYGGGISQVSTTLFNAAFFAGMRFVEFTPHGFYIDRYPEGREATVSWPDLDQKWVNTTDGGVYVKASSSGGSVTVSLYGTKKWDITAAKGPRRNIVPFKKITDDSAACVTQVPKPGFDVTVTRTFKQGGSVVKTEQFNTHYIPEDDVTCTHPDSK